MKSIGLSVVAFSVVGLGACSGSGGLSLPACDVMYDCPMGQTCETSNGTTFACVTSGSGAAGATCSASVGAAVTCGDHLACLAMGDPTAGSCVAWCDSADPCPTGQTCQTVTTTKGATLHFCLTAPCDVVYDCPTGQTCATLDGTTFACMPSGGGAAGASCNATVSSAVTCGDHLLCTAMGDPTAGTCVAWCDSANPCPTNQTCQAVTSTHGVTANLCL